jgi:predicted membrane-bound spermidine synthase
MIVPAHFISFLVGLLSLGAETLWVRTYAFANQSKPTAFAVVLAVYLLGIAKGAAVGGSLCRTADRLQDHLATYILAGSAVIALSPIVMMALVPNNLVLLPLIFLAAFLLSICFPICHHLGTRLGTGHVGKSLSRVYAANILGSVLGPLLANFVVLELFTTQMAFLLIGTAGMLVASVIALANGAGTSVTRSAVGGMAAGVTAMLIVTATQSGAGAMQNLLVANLGALETDIRHVVETRQGIIVSYKDDTKGDAVFGGNVYDGRTNVDARINSNGINRIAVLHAVTPRPRRVLVIGLSVGSWQHIIGGFPGVEHMDVVEINPGYIELARNYDLQRAAISDPRVRLISGDGRKFLRQNPDTRYDLVVMNTTWHWRMYVAMLLSKEFLTLVQGHMTPDAVLAFNTTESIDALKTAKSVFPHAYLYDNFAVAGNFDWRERVVGPGAVQRLREIETAGRPLFGAKDDDVIADYLAPGRLKDVQQAEAIAGRVGEIITDRNLITEYRYGRH